MQLCCALTKIKREILMTMSKISITFYFKRYVGQLGWLNFRGEWGNAKSGCDLEPLSGECRLNHGPVFPGGPDDMPPPRIQRSRYVTATGATSVVSTPAPYYYVIKLQERSPTRPTPPNYRYKRRNNEQESLFHEPNVDISTL